MISTATPLPGAYSTPLTLAALLYLKHTKSPAQGLCTCCSIHLESISPRDPHGLFIHVLQIYSNATFSMKSPLTSLLKTITFPCQSLFSFPILSPLHKSTFKRLIIYLFYCLSPPIRIYCNSLKAGIFALFTAVPSMPRTTWQALSNSCWINEWKYNMKNEMLCT